MSQHLGELLGQNHPKFKQSIMALERRSGHPNNDIRLSSQIIQSTYQKIRELELDPRDTTAKEIYYALNHKLKRDEVNIINNIRTLAATRVNAEANFLDGLLELIKLLDIKTSCLSVRPSVLKRIFKQLPPKKAMKALNYRSIDSMLKHEPMPLILMAINIFESEVYLNNFYFKYKKLDNTSFESRSLTVITKTNSKWTTILNDVKESTDLTLVSCYELASIIILPVDDNPKPGSVITMLINLISEIEVILAVSSYLKIHQVSGQLGKKLYQITCNEPYSEINLLNEQIELKKVTEKITATNVSKYLAHLPHLQKEDLKYENIRQNFSNILGDLNFWLDSHFLGYLNSSEVTSLNVLDVAHNLSNDLTYEKRQISHFRHALSQELTSMYLKPEHIINWLFKEVTLSKNEVLEFN